MLPSENKNFPLEWKYSNLSCVHLSSQIKYYPFGAGTTTYTSCFSCTSTLWKLQFSRLARALQ